MNSLRVMGVLTFAEFQRLQRNLPVRLTVRGVQP